MIIAVDFDGTIVSNCFPEIGQELFFAIDCLKKYKENGHRLILWTCRTDTPEREWLEEALQFCFERGLEFDAVNENLPDAPFAHLGDSRKIYADYYIDDKSLFPLWEAYINAEL